VAGTFDRRKFLTRAAATAAGVAAAGAGGELLGAGAAFGEGTNGPGRNGVSHATPRKGGSLVFGVDAEEQGFNPTTARFDEVGVMYARTVFDPLTIVLPNGNWAPYLAQSVVPNADYTTWTITVRPNVVFHDGTPCNGQALMANFEAALHSLLEGPVFQPVVDSFTQTGPNTVVWNLKQPWVPFPYYLAGGIGGQIAYVMAPSMINAPNGGTDNPVGTGPFKFKQWVPNDHFTATKWSGYWRPGYPYLSQITYKPIPDSDARSEALQAGTIDMMVTDTPQTIVVYRGNKHWSYVDDSGPVVGEPDMNCVQLNLAAAPFTNPDVRLACAKAVSPAAYARIIDIGVNPVSTGLFVPGTPYYSKTTLPKYDPNGAKQLVQKVQSQTGKPVSFALGTTNSPSAIRAATYIQQQYQNAGMQVNQLVVEQNEYIDNALNGKFQAYTWRQFSAVNPDLNYIFWSTTTYNANGLAINMARNNDSRIQAQLEIGRQSSVPAARVEAYQRINEYMAQDLPYLWGDRATWAVVAKPTVQNFNNPTTPTGLPALGLIAGSVWPTQIWIS